jgi:hypothetical protein
VTPDASVLSGASDVDSMHVKSTPASLPGTGATRQ